MKIYLVKFESNVDGEYIFSATPCASEEIAKHILKKEKNFILNESHHFSNLTKDDMETMEIVDEPDHFYINDPCDDYYEDYTIEETELKEIMSDKVATNIEWDIEGLDLDLPAEMEIPVDIADDAVADYLADQTGFCVVSYSLN